MKERIVNQIVQGMLPVLNNTQTVRLQKVLAAAFSEVEIIAADGSSFKDNGIENKKLEELFIAAKKVEGCSEKSLNYYAATIRTMLDKIGKQVLEITTDDLRAYLTDYQAEKKSSKVTIDNIRRILSSFFTWLEDEDYILKSPIRRIHKVKSAATIKETYSDESLEKMRDNCDSLRDLAIIDMLSSTGMRVGEMETVTDSVEIQNLII